MHVFPVKMRYIKPMYRKNGSLNDRGSVYETQSLFCTDGYYMISANSSNQLWFVNTVYAKRGTSSGRRECTFIPAGSKSYNEHASTAQRVNLADIEPIYRASKYLEIRPRLFRRVMPLLSPKRRIIQLML